MSVADKDKTLLIRLNRRDFEYDIYTLVIAFYQGSKAAVVDYPQTADCDICLTVLIDRYRNVDLTQGEKISITIDCKGPDGETETLKREEAVPGRADRSLLKNLLKRELYQALRTLCGRDLPWGDLTGIRPVKIASERLAEAIRNAPDAGRAGAPVDLMGAERAAAAGSSGTEELNSGAGASAEILEEVSLGMQRDYFASKAKTDLAVEIAAREKDILDSLRPEEGYSLYVGIPFCPSICLYCSFSSSPLAVWEKRVGDYLDALEKEIRFAKDCYPGKRLTTVYVGGGTPTTLSPDQLRRLICCLRENFDFSDVAEFTVEAGRPDSISREKLQALREGGVTRISVNPQTMNQKTLDVIGRRHTVEQTEEAFYLARELGFDNINMDLIVGLPGEGYPEVARTMDRLREMKPDDITIHALALKRAARLSMHMDEYEPVSFQASDEIMDLCSDSCRDLGLQPYYLYRQKNMAGNFENVGFARKGAAGLYNILIMEEVQSILALGASGSTKTVFPDGRIERIENVKDVRSYIDRIDEMIARKACLTVQE